MKISPSLRQFAKLAEENNLIVFSHKFSAAKLTPLEVYYSLGRETSSESFLLESVEGENKVCRYSFLGFEPITVFKSRGRNIEVVAKARTRRFKTKKDPCFEVKKIMEGFKVAPMENLRFFGGFVGYLGYDNVRFYEPVGKPLKDALNTYDTYFVLPKFLIIFDHFKRQMEILSFAPLKKNRNIYDIYQRECQRLRNLYCKITNPLALPKLGLKFSKNKVKSNFKKAAFLSAVKKAKAYISAGEIIQVVLSQRISAEFKGDPFCVYRKLRELNPSPYMFYLNFGRVKICGSSPEMLLRCEKGILYTHPIAGTRKRGKNKKEDRLLGKSLLADPKERAEHIMLVDLARNDLGRVAQPATVHLSRFMKVGRFSHVMHIVSEVRARLKKEEDIFSALVSCFPAGTVSGAPKVRAMQIINELEPEKRGIYAGSVGYFSFTNSVDTGIIIRTILFKGKRAYIQAGAGIVADSVPAREYNETVNKAKAQMVALGLTI